MPLSLPRKLALLGGTTTFGDCAVALRLLLTGRLRGGFAISEFEDELARFIAVEHACAFSAGRVALYATLKCLGIGEGDEVLIHVPTHVVVPNAIRYTGAHPIFADCRLDNFNMDFEDAERKITPRTRALILQHTFGIPADIDQALALASRFNLVLIEDCVHALGSEYRGRKVGSFGRAAFFSTEETKTISSTMGGAVVTRDHELASRLREFQRRCPWQPRGLVAGYLLKFILYWLLTEPHLHVFTRRGYEALGRHQPLPQPTSREEGIGERPAAYEQLFSHAQAMLAVRQLRRINENLCYRQEIAEAYAEQLQSDCPTISVLPHSKAAMLRYPVWVEDRETVIHIASKHAVLGRWFTSVLEESLELEPQGYTPGMCPRAEAAAKHLINLPIHSRVTANDVNVLAGVIRRSSPCWRLEPQEQT